MSARVVFPVVALTLAALGAALLVGCFAEGEERGITWVNETQVVLRVEADSLELATFAPGETRVFRTRENLLPDHIQAYDQSGNLRLDTVITWDQLKAQGFRFVITEDMLTPPSTTGP